MLTWISAVMAAFKADSSPPSAIRLLTKRSIMKRRPGLTLISLADAKKHRNALDHRCCDGNKHDFCGAKMIYPQMLLDLNQPTAYK